MKTISRHHIVRSMFTTLKLIFRYQVTLKDGDNITVRDVTATASKKIKKYDTITEEESLTNDVIESRLREVNCIRTEDKQDNESKDETNFCDMTGTPKERTTHNDTYYDMNRTNNNYPSYIDASRLRLHLRTRRRLPG